MGMLARMRMSFSPSWPSCIRRSNSEPERLPTKTDARLVCVGRKPDPILVRAGRKTVSILVLPARKTVLILVLPEAARHPWSRSRGLLNEVQNVVAHDIERVWLSRIRCRCCRLQTLATVCECQRFPPCAVGTPRSFSVSAIAR